jgi:hypothetical protein
MVRKTDKALVTEVSSEHAPNSALLTDAYLTALRALPGAAKRGR